MRKLSKFLSAIIIVAMCFTSSSIKAVAKSNEQGFQVTKETNTCKIVTSESANSTYIFKHNKLTNEVSLSVYSKKNGALISHKSADIDDYVSYTLPSDSEMGMYAKQNQNTFSNYEYTITFSTNNLYELRRPDGSMNGTYFFTTHMKEGYNKEYIDSFISAVEQINALEKKIIGHLGFAAVLAGVSIALSGGAAAAFWTPYLASLTQDVAVMNCAAELDSQCNVANMNYFNAYYHQD